jgi:hypothetical protein
VRKVVLTANGERAYSWVWRGRGRDDWHGFHDRRFRMGTDAQAVLTAELMAAEGR